MSNDTILSSKKKAPYTSEIQIKAIKVDMQNLYLQMPMMPIPMEKYMVDPEVSNRSK
jgi:hypothetical protein